MDFHFVPLSLIEKGRWNLFVFTHVNAGKVLNGGSVEHRFTKNVPS